MRARRFLIGCLLGIALFVAGAAGFAWAAPLLLDAPRGAGCGQACGQGWSCTDANCPRCTMDGNYNWSCTG